MTDATLLGAGGGYGDAPYGAGPYGGAFPYPIDAVLSFGGDRESRTVATPVPAGGTAYVVRPHGPRGGRFEFAFWGPQAQARAAAVEASLATGTPHELVDNDEVSGFRWLVTGQLSFERVHQARGLVWIVRADWSETP